MTVTHPSDYELDDFLLGKSPDLDLAMVEDHLAGCPECQDRAADRAAGDTLTELLAAARTRADADWAVAPTSAPAGSATPSLGPATKPWDASVPTSADDAGAPSAPEVPGPEGWRLGVGPAGTAD
jgi:anti-sigma factor RsiW